MKIHIKTVHEKAEKFECTICERSFTQKIGYSRHIESVHEGKRKYSCDICPKGFTKKDHLKRHVEAIHKIVPNNDGKKEKLLEKNQTICSTCGKKFAQPINLKVHIETVHEGKKPFQCVICRDRFTQRGYPDDRCGIS